MNPNPYINEDLQALAETVRRFADEKIKPGFLERDKTREFDRTLLREMGELGFICPEVPEAFGGLGMGCVAAGVIHEEIARADLSFSYLNLLASLNSQILYKYGNSDVVQPWLDKLREGQAICAIALTEPRGGSDAANLRLKIERDGDFYVINGEKTSISAADQADITVVFGRTGTPESGAHGVTALLVPMDTPGLTTSRFDCHGQRSIGRGSIFFENVRVPVSHRLGDENKGFVQVMHGQSVPVRRNPRWRERTSSPKWAASGAATAADARALRQGLAAAADYIAAALAIHTPRYAHGFTSCVHDHFTYPCPTARALGVGPSEETP